MRLTSLMAWHERRGRPGGGDGIRATGPAGIGSTMMARNRLVAVDCHVAVMMLGLLVMTVRMLGGGQAPAWTERNHCGHEVSTSSAGQVGRFLGSGARANKALDVGGGVKAQIRVSPAPGKSPRSGRSAKPVSISSQRSAGSEADKDTACWHGGHDNS